MEYIMKLNPKYFEYMEKGTKVIEIRLNDEKRKNIKIGDTIIFQKEPELDEIIKTKIEDLIYKKTFREVTNEFDISEYADAKQNKEEYLNYLYKFYTKQQEGKYGVVGIKIRKV